MKKILIVFIIIASINTLYGQEKANHISFMGIPLGTSQSVFEQKLLQQGFIKDIGSNGYLGIYQTDTVKVEIISTPISSTVYGICVIYNNYNSTEDTSTRVVNNNVFTKETEEMINKYVAFEMTMLMNGIRCCTPQQQLSKYNELKKRINTFYREVHSYDFAGVNTIHQTEWNIGTIGRIILNIGVAPIMFVYQDGEQIGYTRLTLYFYDGHGLGIQEKESTIKY